MHKKFEIIKSILLDIDIQNDMPKIDSNHEMLKIWNYQSFSPYVMYCAVRHRGYIELRKKTWVPSDFFDQIGNFLCSNMYMNEIEFTIPKFKDEDKVMRANKGITLDGTEYGYALYQNGSVVEMCEWHYGDEFINDSIQQWHKSTICSFEDIYQELI